MFDRLMLSRFGAFAITAVVSLGCLAGDPSVSIQQTSEKATENPLPAIAIIIDDLGQQRAESLAVTRLPGPVACALLPHMPWGEMISDAAHASGKEVMLHLPLQAMETQRLSGIGEISLDNSREEVAQILEANLASVPHAEGINNHMGSLITRHPGHMEWLMEAISSNDDVFFVDSYTTASSVALGIAREHGIPAVRRHVFLDGEPGVENLQREFDRLIRLAKEQGYAVAIGHPYPDTTRFLESRLPRLEEYGVRLLPVRQLIELQAVTPEPDAVVSR